LRVISKQSGDTLIEVIIAITIIGTILTSAITLSTRAIRLGIAARERSQAAQLLQQQAEGLRSLRDTMAWTDFRTAIDSSCASTFHVERFEPSPGVFQWRTASGPYAPVIDGQPTVFNIQIASACSPLPQPNLRTFTITANWERIGGGTDQSILYTNLANRDFVISYLMPGILVGNNDLYMLKIASNNSYYVRKVTQA
jgi:prepilin-type N-terminal cleavage/methylation domain-containing protein